VNESIRAVAAKLVLEGTEDTSGDDKYVPCPNPKCGSPALKNTAAGVLCVACMTNPCSCFPESVKNELNGAMDALARRTEKDCADHAFACATLMDKINMTRGALREKGSAGHPVQEWVFFGDVDHQLDLAADKLVDVLHILEDAQARSKAHR
jgi:hypothetical protein